MRSVQTRPCTAGPSRCEDRIEASLMTDTIRSLKPKKPVTISESATLGYALQVLIDQEIGAVLVTNQIGLLVGILTERDYLNKVVGIHEDFCRLALAGIMTPNPETVEMTDSLAYALQKMDGGSYRHLPVVEEGRPVGIVLVRDVIRYVTRIARDQ